MDGVVGALLLAVACLLVVWAYGAYRRPHPAPWTGSELISNVIVVGAIGLTTVGIGLASRLVIQAEPFGAADGTAIVAIAAATAVGVVLLRASLRRLRAANDDGVPAPRPVPSGMAAAGVHRPRRAA